MAKPTPGLVSAFNPCGGRAHPGGNVAGRKPWGVSLLPHSRQLQSPQDNPLVMVSKQALPRCAQVFRSDAHSQDAPTSSIVPPPALPIDSRSPHT